jgi:hypothetical protein
MMEPGVMVHAYNPSTWEVETGGSWVWGQSGLPNKIVSQKTKDIGWIILTKNNLNYVTWIFHYFKNYINVFQQ